MEHASCSASLVNGTCVGASCSIVLGLIAPSQCINVEINYDCSSSSQTCSLLTFNSTLSATERCAYLVSNQSCQFVLDPGTPDVQITVPTSSPNLLKMFNLYIRLLVLFPLAVLLW
eukprot:TRINITY_DN352_c0_g1_i18.p1 TRINITY_DN352_c0_g1~~TRINITY_DN352_c0_g1_i18.p1  ORF type:complete len:116 (-),score=26.77 TRINITY_DN352_c0_g1_i18:269-616(-)